MSYLGPFAARIEAAVERLEGAAERIAPPPSAARSASLVDEAWEVAPLAARLAFVRALLDRTHPYQSALQEATALEELRRRGPELESWLATYPSLFADSVSRLEIDARDAVAAADRLALRTLMEAHESLGSDLRAMGVEWVEARPGDALGPDMEVVSAEHTATPVGAVARTRRRGLRFRGRQVLLAQVVRSLGPEPDGPPPARPTFPEPARPVTPPPAESSVGTTEPGRDIGAPDRAADHPPADGEPPWLVALRTAASTADPDGARLLSAIDEVAERAAAGACALSLRGPLAVLAEVAGPRYASADPAWSAAIVRAREGLLAWLADTLEGEPIWPAEGDPFEPGRMERVGTRRTAHPQEQGRVARVERAGVVCGGEPVIPAKVVVYDREEGQ